MDRTGWKKLFNGENRALLVALAQLPDTYDCRNLSLGCYKGREIHSPAQDKMRLSYMLFALDEALKRCKNTVKHTSIFIRCWLRSFFPDRPYKAPFMLTGRPFSERKYLGLLKKCVCFWVRFWRLKEHTCKGEGYLRRSLNHQQQQALKRLWCYKSWRVSKSNNGPDRQVRASSDIFLADGVASLHRESSQLQPQVFATSLDNDDNNSE